MVHSQRRGSRGVPGRVPVMNFNEPPRNLAKSCSPIVARYPGRRIVSPIAKGSFELDGKYRTPFERKTGRMEVLFEFVSNGVYRGSIGFSKRES